jgi:hypothetical protein
VEWFLDDPSRAHLQRYADAGVIALLYGAGAGEEIEADEDGGVFRARAAAYLAAGPLALPGGSGGPGGGGNDGPGGGGGPGGTARVTARFKRLPRAVRRGHQLRVRIALRGPVPARGRLRVTLRRRGLAITRRAALRGPRVYRLALRVPRAVPRGRWTLTAKLPGASRPVARARVRVR